MATIIHPIEGADLITKADVEQYQDQEKIQNITEEEWTEAISCYQNNENIRVFFTNNFEETVIPCRKKVFAIFYENYKELSQLNTKNLEELYEIYADTVFGIMAQRFYSVAGFVRAVKSEFEWEKNRSENLEQLIELTEEEKEKIDKYTPYDMLVDYEGLKEIAVKNAGKEINDWRFSQEEAEKLVNTLLKGGDSKKLNSQVLKELYKTIISGLMDICRFNISHFTSKETDSLRGKLIEDTFDFFVKIIDKVRQFVYPERKHHKIDIKL